VPFSAESVLRALHTATSKHAKRLGSSTETARRLTSSEYNGFVVIIHFGIRGGHGLQNVREEACKGVTCLLRRSFPNPGLSLGSLGHDTSALP
jgi:hypothetical protein